MTFFLLYVFYAHKNAVFFVFVRLYAFCAFCAKEAIFFLSDVFYAHKNAVFFVFVHLYAFVLFVCVKSSRKKKERHLKLPLYPHLLYYCRGLARLSQQNKTLRKRSNVDASIF